MVSTFRRRALWPCLATVALILCACQPPKAANPKDPAFIVAETKDWKITRAELDHEIAGYLKESGASPAQIGSRMPELQTLMLRKMVVEKLLVAKADPKKYKDLEKLESDGFAQVKSQFPTEKDYQDRLKQTGMTEEDLKKQIHNRALIGRYMESEVIKDADPTDKEINDFYLGHQNLFQRPPMRRASTVLVMLPENATPAQKAAAKKRIDAARARVAKGESFSKVAIDVSDDKSTGPKGGDTGFFPRGANVPEFDQVAFSSKVGELSKVFESPLGYQFLEVTEIKPAGTATIDEERQRISEFLHQSKVTQQEQDYVKQLIKDSGVKFNIPMVEPTPPQQQQQQSAPAQNGAPAAETAPAEESSAPAGTNAPPAH